MGYVVERKVYKLVFDDRPGMEVRARSISIDGFLDMAALATVSTTNMTAEDVAKFRDLLDGFAEVLVDWTLEEDVDGETQPVPATRAGLGSQDPALVLEIIQEWGNAIAGISAPKGLSSNGGGPSLEGSLPMEPLSPNPTS